MKKISIFASIWAQNLWDELILKNEIELLKSEFWEGSLFKVASYDVKNPVFQIQGTSYFEYFPIGIKNPKNILRNMRNFLHFLAVTVWSDIVVIGGWWIIYDSEIQSVWNPLNQWLLRVKIARFFRKKIYFYALWIDIKQAENQKKLKEIFRNAWKITVRDEKSKAQLKGVGIVSSLVDDPVINEADEAWKILWHYSSWDFSLSDFDSYNFSWKKVGLALRSWYFRKDGDSQNEKEVIENLCSYIESKWWTIVFMPHSLHNSDEIANDYEFMKQFLNYEREIYANLWEVYTAYTHKIPDIVISMRLHSIILSYVYGIHQIILSYSQKTDEVIKKIT